VGSERPREELVLWDAQTGIEKLRSPNGNDFLGFSPGGGLLLLSRDERVLFQWQPITTIQTFKLNERERWSAGRPVFSRDGNLMASGSAARTIRLWNATTVELIWRAERKNKKGGGFPLDRGGHYPLGFTHDGKSVVSYGGDSVVRFWDIATGKEQDRARIDADEAVLSPDGRLLLAIGERISDDKGSFETGGPAPPRYWDLTKGNLQRPPIVLSNNKEQHFRPCRPVFSPDGSAVAMSLDCDVILIDIATRKELRRLQGHRNYIRDLAFSHDGRLLVSSSGDMTALVWDVSR
jgi:WD40 repeat protein